jgi:Rrf2 family protein
MVVLARETGDRPLTLAEIATGESLPTAFLERILARLRDGGLVRATRGAGGGYHLARPPGTISVAEIVHAIEGPLSLVGCVPDEDGCERSHGCVSRRVWRRLDDAITSALSGISLGELTAEAVEV